MRRRVVFKCGCEQLLGVWFGYLSRKLGHADMFELRPGIILCVWGCHLVHVVLGWYCIASCGLKLVQCL